MPTVAGATTTGVVMVAGVSGVNAMILASKLVLYIVTD